MTNIHNRTAPSRRVPPAARQLGPVTLAIRALWADEAPSCELREQQTEAEERAALLDLRKRIQAQINADLTRVDRCLRALDLMDGDADFEDDDSEEDHEAEDRAMHGAHA